jgi:hypothetical protein
MNRRPEVYVPIILGVMIIVVASFFIVGCEKNEPKAPISDGTNVDSATSNPANPGTNTKPPSVPSTPATPNVDTQANSPCKDSDGGLNYTVKGTLTLTKNGNVTRYQDYCRSATTKFKGYVFEYYCNGTTVGTSNYNCLKGCSDGKCN